MKKLIPGLVFLSAVATWGVSSAAETTLGALNNSFWRLATSQPVIDHPNDFVIWFRDGSFRISSPCRYLLATYELEADGLHFSGDGSNGGSKACADKDRETNFKTVIAAFAAARHYSLSEQRMVFVDAADKSTVELVPFTATGLENRRWLITGYAVGATMTNSTTTTNMPPEITLFNGFIDGSPGCGGFMGGYQSVGDGKFKFSATWVLAGQCEGRQDDWERQNEAITSDLNAAQTTDGDGYRMTLKDGNGHPVLQLTPEPW